VQLDADRCALVLTYHHTLLDGWSMPLLLGELAAAYAARREQRPLRLPSAAPYREFVAWLRQQDRGAAAAFWRRQLHGFSRPTPLGIDRPAPAGVAAPHAETELALSPAAGAAVAALARRLGATASAVVQAALALWLSRCSGDEDVVFGLTVAGRPAELPHADTRIGLFINTLPVRAQVAEDATARQLIGQLLRLQAELLPWQWTPLLLSQAQSDAPAGRALFDVLLVFENYPLTAAMAPAPGLRALATWTFERTSYPLTLVVVPGERWLLRALFAPDRIPAAAAARLLAQLEHLLEHFARAPDDRLAAVSVLPPSQRAELLAAGGRSAPRPATTATSAFAAVAAAHPTAPAVIAGGATWTYAGLAAQARAIASRLAAAGARAGDVVGLCAARSPLQVAALFAIWHCRCAAAPFDRAWPPLHIAGLGSRAGVRIVLGDVDGPQPEGAIWLDLRAMSADGGTDASAPAPAAEATPDDLAVVLFTSGSSGRPKAVEIEHGALAHYAATAAQHFGIAPGDRVLQFASLAFDAALEELLPALTRGAAVVLREDDPSPEHLLQQCARDRITVLDLPTAWFHVLTAHLSARGASLPDAVRLCILGGEAAQARPVATFLALHPRIRLCNTYGPCEATIVSTWCDLTAADAAASQVTGAPLPIGAPIPGAEAQVRDSAGRLLPKGAIGELWLGGAGLARGYRGDDAATAAAFVPHPERAGERLYRTGDLARWRDDGRLEFCGRRDRQAKIAGHRVELGGIEAGLSSHRDVTAAAAVAIPAAGDAPARVVAFAALRAGAATAAADLRAFLHERLPRHSVPQSVHVLPELPRTVHGKVDTAALLELLRREPAAAPIDESGGADALTAAIAAAFAATLSLPSVPPDGDFFALGGDSLAAVRVLEAVRARTGTDPPLAMLLRRPTPMALAAALRGLQPPPPAPAAARADAYDDVTLADELRPAAAAGGPAWRRVLLTGASGFLGARVLRELLARTDAEIIALGRRAPLPGAQRVQFVRGDLARVRFGLDEREFAALARGVDTVIHVAANLNLALPYAALRGDNVLGTREVLRLCCVAGAHLHHVSTAGVFADPGVPATATVDETAAIEQFGGVVGGYAQSKWVAEQLVRRAAARGLPTTVYRPGRLVAGQDGELPERDLVLGTFALCIELGCAPDLPFAVDLTPVDWAAKALVHLARLPGRRATWHLLQATPTSLPSLREQLDEIGCPLRLLPYPDWRRAVIAHLQQAPAHRLAALSLLLGDGGLPPGIAGPRVLAARTATALAGAALPPDRLTAASLAATVIRLQQRQTDGA
jgi:amino acid adenylation domain-containing protein/thioester reductase-like protein